MTVNLDVVIIGGGASGLSAALVLGRARRRVLVVDGGSPRNSPSAHMHGYLTRDGMDPAQFLEIARTEVRSVGVEIRQGTVREVAADAASGFAVTCADGTVVRARAVLLATGLRDELPDIDGVAESWGGRVVHCPYCHGYEVRDTPLGVVGGDNRPFTIHQAALVRQWSSDVTFFTNTVELKPDERTRLSAWGVRVIDGPVARLAPRDEGLDVVLRDGTDTWCSTVFVGPRFLPVDELLDPFGCARDESGWITTDSTGMTSVSGVFVAGNVVDSPAQLIDASSGGSRAAIGLNHYLLARDIASAVS